MTFSGNYYFRNLWNGCETTHPEIWTGDVLQSSDSILTLGFQAASPSTIGFSLGVDGTFPDTRFDLLATGTDGDTATVTATVSLGRISVTCSKPVKNLRITHTGPNWILDSVAF